MPGPEMQVGNFAEKRLERIFARPKAADKLEHRAGQISAEAEVAKMNAL
jgi:hypothetical protein